MSSATLLAALGNGLFTVAMLVAATRCLLLWRRTRQAPELAIGVGFGAIAAFGYPLMAVSGLSGGAVAEVDLVLLGAGLGAIGIGVFSLQVFTWQAFRARDRWAVALVAASFVAAAVVGWGSVQSIAAAAPDASPTQAARVWWLALRGLFEAWYVWTAIEGGTEYLRARRRFELGLSDAVVVDRFKLWGFMGLFLAANGALGSWLEWQGMSPLVDIAPALVLAANGGVAGALILLIFMPPRSYLDFVRRRAGAGARTVSATG